MLKLTESKPERSLLKNISKVFSGTLIGQAFIVIFSPILTRVYSPEAFGELGVFTSITGSLWVLTTLRLDLAIPIADLKEDTNTIKNTALIVSAVLSGALFIISLLIDWHIIEQLVSLKFDVYFWAIPLGTFLTGTYYILNSQLIRNKKYTAVSIAKGSQGAVMSLTQWFLSLFSSSASILAMGYNLGYLVSNIYQESKTRLGRKISIKNEYKAGKSLLIKYKEIPFFAVPASFANIISLHLPPVLFASVYDLKISGFFLLSQRCLGMPINMVTMSISQVLLGESKEMLNEDATKVYKLYFKIIKTMLILGVIPFIILFLYGEQIFEMLFGKDWKMAGEFAEILAIMFFTRGVTTPLSQTLNLLKLQKIQFIWDILRLVGMLSLFYFAKVLQLQVMSVIWIFTTFISFTFILHVILSLYYIKRIRRSS